MLQRGTRFAGYRIEQSLGAGGMGAVYLARHPRLPRSDALKILAAAVGSDAAAARRFEREADLAARLSHRNIVTVFDRGVEHGRRWIAMQYVAGVDVARLLDDGPLPPDRAVHILAEVARGLDHAHTVGVLHRDVKPANILVADSGDDNVLITDFGIAHSLDESVALTTTGAVIGTLAYVAPEQIQGGDIDGRADIYSLGATLYEMLTGRKPFAGSTPLSVLHAHLTEPPPEPSAVDPGLRAFDAVIATAMAKDPARRYRTCRALAEAAERAAAEKPTLRAEPVAYDVRTAKSTPLEIVVSVCLLVAAVVCALVLGIATRERHSSDAGKAASYGSAQWIADLYPALIPKTATRAAVPAPEATGYRGLTCHAENTTGLGLWCPSRSGNPSNSFLCQRGRELYPDGPPGKYAYIERLDRPDAPATLWRDTTDGSAITIVFDTTPRSQCAIVSTWDRPFDDLLGWWRTIPRL
ncbi:serine/threonine-protein kinase [Nocardia sp. NPDC127579]|uniref:serine/threonine-protein kinase n=1 Tax=Nocardia sp. NPDC127579 TaxID=3345402 RepID=UPI00363CB9A8